MWYKVKTLLTLYDHILGIRTNFDKFQPINWSIINILDETNFIRKVSIYYTCSMNISSLLNCGVCAQIIAKNKTINEIAHILIHHICETNFVQESRQWNSIGFKYFFNISVELNFDFKL